ncbi:MAG: hypothetical protein AB1Z19_08665 [Eubacteriales bacterium]
MMAKEKETVIKADDVEVVEVKRTDETIIFKVNQPVPAKRFELIDEMVRKQVEKSGLKIVLMPYSCDVVEK